MPTPISAGYVALAVLRHKKLLDVPIFIRKGGRWIDFADMSDADFKTWVTEAVRRAS